MRVLRIITYSIVLLFLVTILASCIDDEVITTEGIIFELIEGKNEYAVVGYEGTSQNVIIAETHNQLPVTRVGVNAFRDLDIDVLSIDLPDSMLELEQFSLDTLNISVFRVPRNLKYFAQAFGPLKQNIDFIIPNDHQYLEETLISSHRAIMTIDEEELIYVYDTKITDESLIIPNSIKRIGHSALSYTHFTEINIPDSVEIIESYAFYNNRSTTVNIPNSIIRIGPHAYSLTNPPSDLVLPNGLEVIEIAAFYESKINSVELPESLTYLHPTAFGNSNNNFSMHNKVNSFKFHGFRLTSENLTDFTNLFAYSTFKQNYYPSSQIDIHLPSNQTEADLLISVLETSLSIAPTISSGFPEITLKFVNPNE